jgi:8-oxo-dGTP pyrophosphatase MutT (NUDIX family)
VKPWKVLEKKTLLSRRWLELSEEHVVLPNGHAIEQFHVIRAPDWASTLCVTREDRVLLVRQYRHGLGGTSLELPAGVIEAGESPLAAAQRELREETGFEADRWLALSSVATEPARHTTRAHFFCALGGHRVQAPALDDSEELELVEVEKLELGEFIERGEIQHGVHVGAILLALKRGLV